MILDLWPASTELEPAWMVLARAAWAKVCFDNVRSNPSSTQEQWDSAKVEYRKQQRQVQKMDREEHFG